MAGGSDPETLYKKVDAFVEDNFKEYIGYLKELISYRSVSAWGGDDLYGCAEYIRDLLRQRGFKVEVKSYGGHPVVMGELGGGNRSLIIYNHYDVQPPDPLDLWDSDPFNLVEKDGKLYGRGVADNKGNIAARIGAIDAIADSLEDLDLKIKYVIEGEEEIGSPTLHKFVEENREWIKSLGGIWETGYIRRDGRLGINLGFKGMLYIEIIFKGPNRDVHSGYSAIIPNPAWKLVRMLSILKDEKGNVLIPGFYDDIEDLGNEAIKLLENLGENLDDLKRELGIDEFVGGVEGLDALKQLYLKPSLNISGLYSGYTGKGSKTIVPSVAGAKIDIRLVPGQDPEKILESFKSYIESKGFRDYELIIHGSYRSGYTKYSEKIVQSSIRAAKKAYNKDPAVAPLSAGSGPIYLFTHVAQTPMTGGGVGYYGSRTHSPNENIRVTDFKLGMKHIAYTIIDFAYS